jgi:uncharacterized protein YaiL (DUF2058 family)
MAEDSSNSNTRKSNNAAKESLTLSAALLSPINSLFEAQVQSARAFLNFILQMGFKDKVTETDIKKEKARLESLGEFRGEKKERLLELEKHVKAQVEYNKLRKKEDLSAEEKEEKAKLDRLLEDNDMKEDVWTMRFQYVDGQNQEHTIIIPALALVPVQPLAIKRASFDFFMSVESKYEQYIQNQPSRVGKEESPWFFIQPKRIRGKIDTNESNVKKAGINISVEVESTPIPQGLANLLTSLTQSGRITDE